MASTQGKPSGLRDRRPVKDKDKTQNEAYDEKDKMKSNSAASDLSSCLIGSYWLTRVVMLRSLAFIYLIAFLVALHQNRALLGQNGLLPAQNHLNQIKSHAGGVNWRAFTYAPTLLWLCDYEHNLDQMLDMIAYAGILLSTAVLLRGGANLPIMLCLWILYQSLVNVGQRWYSFGWESQLLETGFLAAFLCPLFSMKSVPDNSPPSIVPIWGFRWLIFRIMIGAGLIKIRGDQCWRDLTCMNYHYQTQPVPNPVSYYMHQEPEVWHKTETLGNHFVELVAPFLIFLTRRCRLVGGTIQILFQIVLIISGNLSFLNWLTILPSICCFDDASLAWLFSKKRGGVRWQVEHIQTELKTGKHRNLAWTSQLRRLFNVALACLLVYLSVPVVQNLMSTSQRMNTTFEPFRIVNTYGAFGSITKERTEVIFQGTYDDPEDWKAQWKEYEFKCKPGNVTRRPCLISPYHYRLDWLMWFAAFQNYQHNPWLVHLAAKFLVNDEATLSLIAHNPFEGQPPPKWIRAEHYRYVFTKIGGQAATSGDWWKRKRIGNYMPAVSLNYLNTFMKNMGWPVPRLPEK